MDWSIMTELGTVGVLVVLLVEGGKRLFPDTFRSDTNVWWSIVFGVVLNIVQAMAFDGGNAAVAWASIPEGALIGAAASGVYRGIAGSSKRNSVDMTEQIHETIVTTPAELRALVGAKDDEDEGEPIGFKTK